MLHSRHIPPADDAVRTPTDAPEALTEFPEPSRGPARPLSLAPVATAVGTAALTDEQFKVAHERRSYLVAAWKPLEDGETLENAAAVAGIHMSKLSRLLDIAKPVISPTASHLEKCAKLLSLDVSILAPGRPTGLVCEYRAVLEDKKAADKLRLLYLATVGASSDYMTSDRRTAKVATALKRFADEPECPADLAVRLRDGYQPSDFIKFLRKITPEVEAKMRGPKHYQLHGSTSRRDMNLRLPDGTRADLPAGFLIEFDDMSINQPFWVNGPDGKPQISRQGLYARDVKSGRWLGFELVSRPREAYRAEDIQRFLRRLMTVYGKFDVLRLEKGIWQARSIRGYKITDVGAVEEEWTRPAMDKDGQALLQQGIKAIGVRIHYVSSAKGKGGIESGFRYLQDIAATYTPDRVNIGRHAGEFEFGAKQMRRVRAESHTPQSLNFAAMDELAGRIEQAMGFINKQTMERSGEAPDTTWTRDMQARSLPQLSERDLAVFLPVERHVSIRGLMVASTVDGRRFDFRAPILAELGDNYRLSLRFDPSEPTLGAALYNRETSSSNHHGWVEGQYIGWAAWEIPGPQLDIDATSARGLTIRSVEEIYGAGAEDTGNSERRRVDKHVSTSFRALARPGQPALKASTQRDGEGRVAKMESAETMTAAPKATPRREKTVWDAPTPDQVRKKNSRNASQLAALRKVQEMAS